MKLDHEANVAGSAEGRKGDHMRMNTISIKLTQANGNTREVQYEIESAKRAEEAK